MAIPRTFNSPEDELIRLEAQGRASFALQYQFQTSLSDSECYPLRQHDLIVKSLDHLKAQRDAAMERG